VLDFNLVAVLVCCTVAIDSQPSPPLPTPQSHSLFTPVPFSTSLTLSRPEERMKEEMMRPGKKKNAKMKKRDAGDEKKETR
jgi:hypothetical protein